MVDELWGKIQHPTLTGLVSMIDRTASKWGLENVVLWKMDLKGAFSLLFIRPQDVRLLAFELTDGLTMLYHTGMFGHTEMPCSFDVVTRVLRRTINRKIDGECDMYVDDILGCSHVNSVVRDVQTADGICHSLLGKGAVEQSKTEMGRVLDWIGWKIDLNTQTVTIAEHNFLKTFHGFMTLDIEKAVSLLEIQRLASWASRYVSVCRFMKPFVSDLFGMMRGFKNSFSKRHLSDSARICVLMWRCCLTLIEFGSPAIFHRSLESYLPREPRVLIEFDASLKGIGLMIFRIDDQRQETLWKVAKFMFPFHLDGDSSFQNTCEFMGLLLAVGCLIHLGVRSSSIIARGDSITALRWIVAERFKSGPSRNAAMCYIALGMKFDIDFHEAIHIKGVDNVICDQLSRDYTPEQLGFKSDIIIDVLSEPKLVKLMSIANPLDDACHSGLSGFIDKWSAVYELADVFP
jgi:hypothetical protein